MREQRTSALVWQQVGSETDSREYHRSTLTTRVLRARHVRGLAMEEDPTSSTMQPNSYRPCAKRQIGIETEAAFSEVTMPRLIGVTPSMTT